jgi:hypothetical protein
VLTSGYIAPHLSHRDTLILLENDGNVERVVKYDLDTILIAQQHLGLGTSPQVAEETIAELLESFEFNLVYQQQDVFLLKKNS